jgi:phage replication-related protein YjqB (UPF0714/DUF867 family)
MARMTRPTFAEMLAMPGVVEECEIRSQFGFMAYHGGALEQATDVIARQAAALCGASYYGVVQPESMQLHVSSIRVTPDQSTMLASFLDHVDVVITIHGFGRRPMPTSLLLGGTNRSLATHVADHLRDALPDYSIIDQLDQIPLELRGVHVRNPVNLPRRAGVQIELPARIRDHTVHARTLIETLASAARSWT